MTTLASLFLVLAALFAPDLPHPPIAQFPCYGPELECTDLPQFYELTVNRDIVVCEVHINNGNQTVSFYRDGEQGYLVKGMRTRTIQVTTCPTCSPIERLWVYYMPMRTIAYLPFIGGQP